MATINSRSLASVYIPLRMTYGIVPIVAGLDKFTNYLVNWQQYLPSLTTDILPVNPAVFMMIVGVIEIVAGTAVLTILPRLGAYVVMVWLVLIAGAVAMAGFLDIAVRDLVMAVGAYSLGQVAGLCGENWLPGTSRMEGTSNHAIAS